MPALNSPRQERFCQLLKQGIPPFRAYPAAGYRKHPGDCYRLRDSERVKRRLAELTKAFAMKTRVTVESLTQEFNDAIALAHETKNAPAVTQAAIAKGKLHGLMIDRKESGAPGDFSGLTTPEQVLAAVKAELGEQAALLLQAALAKPEPADIAGPEPSDTVN